jgi:hypothetical protein
MLIIDITSGDTITAEDYDQLTCCDKPAIVGHATEVTPIAGATCPACMCTITSLPGYGTVNVNRCFRHPAS